MDACAAFLVAAALGGSTTAVSTWLASGIAALLAIEIRFAILVGLLVLACAADWGLVDVKLPSFQRQVPRSVFDRGLRVGAIRFGVEMGLGFMTHTTAALPYVLWAAIALGLTTLPQALAAGAAFGASRGVIPLLRGVSNDPTRWDNRLDSRSRFVLRMASLTAVFLVTAWILTGS